MPLFLRDPFKLLTHASGVEKFPLLKYFSWNIRGKNGWMIVNRTSFDPLLENKWPVLGKDDWSIEHCYFDFWQCEIIFHHFSWHSSSKFDSFFVCVNVSFLTFCYCTVNSLHQNFCTYLQRVLKLGISLYIVQGRLQQFANMFVSD